MPVFCVDCKHFIKNDSGAQFSQCAASPKDLDAAVDYLVTGIEEPRKFYFCRTARLSQVAGDCGPEGRLFEARA